MKREMKFYTEKFYKFSHPEFKKEYVILAEEGTQSDEDDMIELIARYDQ